MRKFVRFVLFCIVVTILCLFSCSNQETGKDTSQEANKEVSEETTQETPGEVIVQEEIPTYHNPVMPYDRPDPTIWYDGSRFYTVSTGIGSIFASKDMVNWYKLNSLPLSRTAQEQAKSQGTYFWAPDVVKVGEKWMLYLTCYNSASDCGIAALSSDKASGPFEWEGIITHSKTTGIKDTIDPEVVYDEESSKLWLFFGSIGSIHRVLLAPDGRSIAPGAEYIKVAGLTYSQDKSRVKVFEGSYLYRHGSYWYLFVSSGNYGDASYRIKVGRSATLEGEFVDKDGNKMLDGYASEILTSVSSDKYYGPGHNGEIFTDLRGQEYMFYHCHDSSTGNNSRYIFLQRIFWDRDEWPYFEGGKPVGEDYMPKF